MSAGGWHESKSAEREREERASKGSGLLSPLSLVPLVAAEVRMGGKSRLPKTVVAVLFGAVLLVTLLLVSRHAEAEASALQQEEDRPLRVGVSHLPPYAIHLSDGWDGLAIHLWEQSALAMDLNYELIEIDPDVAVGLLLAGELDVVLTGVATVEAEKEVDFTHSYYTTMLGFAEPGTRDLLEIGRAIFSPRFLRITFWIVLALLVIGLLVWFLERQANEEMFGGGAGQGLWSGFWWAAVTMTTLGYGDKTPITVGGRILALVWMLVALGITASLTATVTSVLTLGVGSSTIFPEDLRDAQVGSVDGSTGADYLEAEGIGFTAVEEPVEGLRQMDEGELDFFVYDLALLRYVNQNTFNGTFTIVPAYTYKRQYAFMVPRESGLLEPLNRVLLAEMNSARWQAVLSRLTPEPAGSR